MTGTKKPTKEEILDALAEEDDAEEAERIGLLSDDELDRELAGEGFDPAAERARGRALGALARRPKPGVSGATRWITLLAAAFAVAVLAVALRSRFSGRLAPIGPEPSVALPSPPPRPPPPSPADLRRRAFEACDADLWSECLADLDAARALDGAGDGDPAVQTARRRAAAALAPPPPRDPLLYDRKR